MITKLSVSADKQDSECEVRVLRVRCITFKVENMEILHLHWKLMLAHFKRFSVQIQIFSFL